VIKEFITKIICEHGTPEAVLADQGTNFLSEVFKNVCKLLKITKVQTTPKAMEHWRGRTELWLSICDTT